MKQLFAPEIRRKYSVSKFITFDVHQDCNTAYKMDEDYFVHSLMPFARGSESGDAIYAKVLRAYRGGQETLLLSHSPNFPPRTVKAHQRQGEENTSPSSRHRNFACRPLSKTSITSASLVPDP